MRYVSHEVRTPLNTVVLGLKLLRDNITSIPESSHILCDVQSSCETALEILNGFLDYEKLDSKLMKLELKKLQVWPFIRDAVQPFLVQVSISVS